MSETLRGLSPLVGITSGILLFVAFWFIRSRTQRCRLPHTTLQRVRLRPVPQGKPYIELSGLRGGFFFEILRTATITSEVAFEVTEDYAILRSKSPFSTSKTALPLVRVQYAECGLDFPWEILLVGMLSCLVACLSLVATNFAVAASLFLAGAAVTFFLFFAEWKLYFLVGGGGTVIGCRFRQKDLNAGGAEIEHLEKMVRLVNHLVARAGRVRQAVHEAQRKPETELRDMKALRDTGPAPVQSEFAGGDSRRTNTNSNYHGLSGRPSEHSVRSRTSGKPRLETWEREKPVSVPAPHFDLPTQVRTEMPTQLIMDPSHSVDDGETAAAEMTSGMMEATRIAPSSVSPKMRWYVTVPDGERMGPMSEDALREGIRDGRFPRESYVYREGWAEWVGVDEFLLGKVGGT